MIEDLHWADEATLEFLLLAARRIDRQPVLILATFRDTELGPTDPLQSLLGDLATFPAVGRLQIPR